MKQQLTVKEALEQGYRHYDNGSGYTQEIEDIDEDEDFPHGSTLYSPIESPLVKITPETLKDILSDWIYDHVGNKIESESVAEKACHKILNIDLSDMANMINSLFEKEIVYKSTNIELIP